MSKDTLWLGGWIAICFGGVDNNLFLTGIGAGLALVSTFFVKKSECGCRK